MDVIYRRVDDDFSDPLAFRRGFVLGCAGLFNAYRAGNVTVANAFGTGWPTTRRCMRMCREIIKYYLDEEPILHNVETYLLTEAEEAAACVENLDKLVVKAVGESGGYGMLIGPQSTARSGRSLRGRLRPIRGIILRSRRFRFSRAPCLIGDAAGAAARGSAAIHSVWRQDQHCAGRADARGVEAGSLVVNSSQGGGSKDTWVLSE